MNWCLDYDYTFVSSLIPWMICKKMEEKVGFCLEQFDFCYTKMGFGEIGRNGWMNHGFLLILS